MEFISGFIQSSEASCSIAVRKKKNVTEKMNQNKVAFSLSSLWRLPFYHLQIIPQRQLLAWIRVPRGN
jgi:hypothetical protein